MWLTPSRRVFRSPILSISLRGRCAQLEWCFMPNCGHDGPPGSPWGYLHTLVDGVEVMADGRSKSYAGILCLMP